MDQRRHKTVDACLADVSAGLQPESLHRFPVTLAVFQPNQRNVPAS
ncbi:Uncharacterised protein [Vibrio cholerae]|nr:Uncharacterised protein [Vibrio cholerae]